MNKTSKMHWVLAAAVSMTLATGAMAQFRVGTDGRARDASNRVGSGGFNTGYGGQASVAQGNYLQNNLITGNITGGKQFRGSVPYQSPDSFRGNTAGGLSDRFIRSSSAAPYGGVPQNNAQAVQSFYGASNAAPPPPGYVQQGTTSGAFVPAKPMSRAAGDLRLGAIPDAPTNTMLPQPGQFLMPGPVDPNTSASTVITGSPLYGVRQWNTANLSDQQFLNSNMSSNGTNIGSKLDPVTLQRMRSELVDPMQSNNQNNLNDSNKPTQPLDGASGTQNLSGSALTPMESPRNQPLGGASILQSNDSQSSSALGGSLQTGASASARQRPGANPVAQSTQYAELQKRMSQYRIIQENNDANANATDQRTKKTEPAKKPTGIAGAAGGQSNLSGSGAGTVGSGISPITPGGIGVQPRPIAPPAPPSGSVPPPSAPMLSGNVPNNTKPAPVQVKSLADGVKAAGLASLMKEAEEQMKAGKFSSALDKYDDADQVAPGDPFVMLGKANALLGQSYYARAERSLRDAFMKDQNLLLGQYDLRSFLSAERLQFLVTELKGLADAEQKEPRHAFLLAYIAYNSGFEAQASAYLSLAEQRSGGNDPLYPLLRKYWSLPTQTEAPAPLNK